MPNTKPLRTKEGSRGNKSGASRFRLKSGAPPNAQVPKAAEIVLAIAMGKRALNEKCLKTASCAKIMPPIGALNPADIAAATPQLIKTSGGIILTLVICERKLAILAPKFTNGPYWPTGAPALNETSAAKVDPTPRFKSSSLSVRWDA